MDHPSSAPTAKRRSNFWPWIVPTLLLCQVVVSAMTVYLAVADPSFATEPDYYRKSLQWDASAAQRRVVSEQGWRLQVGVSSLESAAHERAIQVLLHDREGQPIAGAEIEGEAFSHARASERFPLEFKPDGAAYAAALKFERVGLWEIRLQARAREHTFASTHVLDVAPATGTQP